MKNIKIFTVIILLFTISSCKKYLAETVYSSSQTSNFYVNEQQGISALNGVYGGLRDTYFNYQNDYTLFRMLEGPTGTVTTTAGFMTMNYSLQDLTDIQKMWNRMWVCVDRAGTLIKLLKVENIDSNSAKRILAEAKFVRALCYFNLVRMWGQVPLNYGVESLTDAYPKKVKESVVYNQIIQDLKDASADLPTWNVYVTYGSANSGNPLTDYQGYQPGRATKGAAQALLAKVYLNIASSIASNANLFDNAFDKNDMYTKSRDLCDSVYSGAQGYGLTTNYADVFKAQNENGIEDIFSIQFLEASDIKLGNSLAAATGIKGTGILSTEIGVLRSIPAFLGEFSDTDTRKDATFFLQYINKSNTTVTYPTGIKLLTFKKYWSDYQISANNIPMQPTTYVYHTSAADKGRFGDNIPVLRYSDVLLMYAETLYALGDLANASERVADVRERAGLGRTIPTGDLMDVIIAERRRELCFEMQLWFDYQRLNIRQKYRLDLADSKYKYFPIPNSDITMDAGLQPQNPGW
jgi:starch-binding outer membrane protein, SusD/RagB family